MGQRKKESYVIRIDPKKSVSKRKITARVNEIGIKMNIKILYSNWHKLQTCASIGKLIPRLVDHN